MRTRFFHSTLSVAILAAFAMPALADTATQSAEADTELEEIVVTASGSGSNLKNAPASVSVIHEAEIKREPVTSIGELISKQPGVSGGTGLNAEAGKIKLRGLPSEYSLILVDGRRIGNSSRVSYRPDLARQDLDWISPEAIQRIEVVKGPMSSLYGSDAMGGVVNIITKKIPDEWTGSATINYKLPSDSNAGDTIQTSATVAGPILENLGTRITVSQTQRDADTGLSGDDFADSTTGIKNQNIDGKLAWEVVDGHVLELFGTYGKQTNTNPSFKQGETGSEFWLGGDGEKDTTVTQRYGLAWDGEYDWGSSKFSVYRNEFEKQDEMTEVNGVLAPTDQKNAQTVIDGKINTQFQLGVEHNLTVGGQWKKEELTNSRTLGINSNGAPSIDGTDHTGNTDVEGTSWALFLEDSLKLTDKFTLTLGGRLDDDDRYGTQFSPRGYGVYNLTDSWTLKGGISCGFRAPDLVQTAPGFSTGSRGKGCMSTFGTYDPVTNPNGFQSSYNKTGYVNCFATGNPDLKPEESTNYEFGFNFQNQHLNSSLTYFHTDFKNKILSQAVKHTPSNQIDATYQSRYPYGIWYTAPTNAEHAKIRGLEGSLTWFINDELTWRHNATYFIETKNEDTGAALIDTPKFAYNTDLLWSPMEKLHLGANARYVGSQYTTQVSDNPDVLEAYWTFGLNANYDIAENFTIRGGVSNVFNKQPEKGDDAADYHSIEGRAFFVGLTAKF